MDCYFCGKPWEPTGHWCLMAPDAPPPPPDLSGVVEAQRRRIASLEVELRNVVGVLRSEMTTIREEASSGPRR